MELKGKTAAFLGDSITEGQGTSSPEFRYDIRIAKNLGLKTALNYGISGTRIAHQHKASIKPRWDLYFSARAYDIAPGTDLIVVFGGTNDYGHGDAPFGTMEDTTPDTYCGGVEFLMRVLKEQHPNSQIAFLTPIRRLGDEAPYIHEYKQPDARPLWDYAQVILEKGRQHRIPVLDAYNGLGIDPNLEADCQAYTVDGTHLNDAGHEKLAALVCKFLKSILDHDLSLSYESISMADGHAGSDVTYIAATREVVRSSWCVRKKKFRLPFTDEFEETKSEDRLPIPPEITTEKELRSYVRQKHSAWLRDSRWEDEDDTPVSYTDLQPPEPGPFILPPDWE